MNVESRTATEDRKMDAPRGTLIQRRNFIVGLASMLAAPAIVRAENIMPVRNLIVPEPMVHGLRWQSWRLGTERPEFFAVGSVGEELGRGPLKPLSHFLSHIEWHKKHYPELNWRPMETVQTICKAER